MLSQNEYQPQIPTPNEFNNRNKNNNMSKKLLSLTILSFLVFPQIVLADVIVPLSTVTFPLIPFIILIETLVFWLMANKLMKIKVGFWKSLLIVAIANLATSLIGTIIPLYKYAIGNLIWIGIAFILSVFIEWAIYLPFFWKNKVKKTDLLKLSLAGNFITYTILAVLQSI
jgi:hypothetical protein